MDIRSLWWSTINSFECGQLEIRVTGGAEVSFGARASSRVFQRVSRFAYQRALIIAGSQLVGTSEKKIERGENEREKRKLVAKKMKKRGKENVLACSLSLSSFRSFPLPESLEQASVRPVESQEKGLNIDSDRTLRVFLRG